MELQLPAVAAARLPLGLPLLELRLLLGREDAAKCLMLFLADGFHLWTKRLQFRLHIGGLRIVGLFESAQLLLFRFDRCEEILVLGVDVLARLLDRCFLLGREIERAQRFGAPTVTEAVRPFRIFR